MAYNANPDNKTWSQCLNLLADVFGKWKEAYEAVKVR